jgi:hypothetical protein
LSDGQADKRREKKILADAISFRYSKELGVAAAAAAVDTCSSGSAPPKGVLNRIRCSAQRSVPPKRLGGVGRLRKLKTRRSALTVTPDGKWELHGQSLFISAECAICLEEVSLIHFWRYPPPALRCGFVGIRTLINSNFSECLDQCQAVHSLAPC